MEREPRWLWVRCSETEDGDGGDENGEQGSSAIGGRKTAVDDGETADGGASPV